MSTYRSVQLGPFPLAVAHDMLVEVSETGSTEPHPFSYIALKPVGDEHASIDARLPIDDPNFPLDRRLNILEDRLNRLGYLGNAMLHGALVESRGLRHDRAS